MGIILIGINFEGRTSLGLATTVPGSPVSVVATGGNAQATVAFAAPANGGSAITGYTVVSSPPGGTDTNAGTTSLSHVVTGLTNGVSYTFQVYATNALGNGPNSSSSNAVTPVATDPYWSGVAILLSGESPTATPIATFSKTPLSVTQLSVNTENSATQFKFGTKSVWKKDAAAILTWTDNASYGSGGPIRTAFRGTYPELVTQPFTIETFFRASSRPSVIFSTVNQTLNTSGGWSFMNIFGNGNYQLARRNHRDGGGNSTSYYGIYDYANSYNTWINFALSFDGTTSYAFVDGQLIGALPGGLNKVGGIWEGFRIGGGQASYWDETRLTVGTCRYTSNYTVATGPYPRG